jgi:choice-of-anchor A domain-containing protein
VCDDDNACTTDACHPRTGCEYKAKVCDDGAFCNGVETCDPESGECAADGSPCQGDLTCDESANACVECVVDSDCRPYDDCSTATCEFNVCDYDSSACEEECVDAIELGALTQFNLLACGDYVGVGRYGGESSDVEGKLAVAGNLTLRGFGVAERNPGPLALVVGGAWTLLSGTVHGSAHYGAAGSATSVDFQGGVSQSTPLDFGDACAAGVTASRQAAALPVNGTTTVQPWRAIELRGIDPVRNVFEVPVDALNVCNSFAIITPVGAAVVINVIGGSSAMLSNFQTFFNEPNQQNNPLGTPRDVLWNFPEATQLVIQGFGVKGSLLAPFADVEFNNGHIDGSMIAGSVSGDGEFHHVLFRHDLTCPPAVEESVVR